MRIENNIGNFFSVGAWKKLSKSKKALILALVALAIYAIIGFLIVPSVTKSILIKKLPETLNRQVTIGKISLNPFSLTIGIENFDLARRDGSGSFVRFKNIRANLEILSIVKKALIVRLLILDQPFIGIDYLGEKTYSFSDLVPDAAKNNPSPKGTLLFSVCNIEITGGKLEVNDLPKGKTHHINKLHLVVPFLSNLPGQVESYVQPAFSAEINGTATSLSGLTKPFAESLATEINIDMEGINIPEYLSYIPNPTDLRLRSAMVDIKTKLTYLAGNDDSAHLSLTGTIAMRDLDIGDLKDNTYLNLPKLAVTLADSNLLKKEMRIAEIAISKPRVNLIRADGGTILPLALFPKSGQQTAEEQEDQGEEEGTEGEVQISIDRLHLENGSLAFIDQALAEPGKIELADLNIDVNNLSTMPGETGAVTIAASFNKSSTFRGEGKLTLNPVALSATMAADTLPLPTLKNYLSEYTTSSLDNGNLDLSVSVDIEDGDEMVIASSAGLKVTDLVMSELDSGEEFLTLQNLAISGAEYSSRLGELSVEEIAIENPVTTIIINDEGSVNLGRIMKKREGPPRQDTGAENEPKQVQEPEKTKETTLSLNSIAVHGGKIHFLDGKIQPAYEMDLDFNGTVSGLSNRETDLATVEFDGKVDGQAPLTIRGKINPLRRDNFADVKMEFTGFNMSSLSPYTGKYIGYKTSKGKMNLDINYNVAGRNLDSQNKAFLDQFTLGEKVESEDATSLPVGLAISLLQNRQGEIKLNIPVKGNLDDPKFSVGGVVIQVIVNLIAKAATSPFALLGSLIPSGTDIQHIIFSPGMSELSEEVLAKLGVVTDILYDRPGLKMEIAGRISPVEDRKALARLAMTNRVKLEKHRQSGIASEDGEVNYRDIELAPDEYSRYLEIVFNDYFGAAPPDRQKDFKAIKPAVPSAAIKLKEDFILGETVIADEDLRLLALERSNLVLNHLVETGKIGYERLFVVEPQPVAINHTTQDDLQPMVELLIK